MMQTAERGVRQQPAARPSLAIGDALLGTDHVIRARIEAALAEERLTAHGLALLRDRYRLTPAETNVFVEYYLTNNPDEGPEPKRRALARRLNLSENTLMHHITSIRRKLGLVARSGSATVLMWCLSTGITRLDSIAADHGFSGSQRSGR